MNASSSVGLPPSGALWWLSTQMRCQTEGTSLAFGNLRANTDFFLTVAQNCDISNLHPLSNMEIVSFSPPHYFKIMLNYF